MLGNVIGLFPYMGSDAVHGSIYVCHLLLRCPIVCLRLFFATHLVLVLLVSVVSARENGGRSVCTLLYSRTGCCRCGYTIIWWCGPSCMIAQVDSALTMHSLGHFPAPQKGESSPRLAPSLCGGLNLGRLRAVGGVARRPLSQPPPLPVRRAERGGFGAGGALPAVLGGGVGRGSTPTSAAQNDPRVGLINWAAHMGGNSITFGKAPRRGETNDHF